MLFYKIVKWTARILSILLFAFFLVFAVGEGVHPTNLTTREMMMFLSLFISFAGMIFGWRRELSGGTLTIAGYICFVAIEGRFPLPGWFNPYFAAIAFIGLLFILAGWLQSRIKPDAVNSTQEPANT